MSNQSLDGNIHQNRYGVDTTESVSSSVLTKRALVRPITTCPPPSTFLWSMCDRFRRSKAYTIACNMPIAFIDDECGPEEFCVDRVPNQWPHVPLAQWGRASCFSHDYIVRLVSASVSATEKYVASGLASGLGQLAVKWHSGALGGDLYIRGFHTEL